MSMPCSPTRREIKGIVLPGGYMGYIFLLAIRLLCVSHHKLCIYIYIYSYNIIYSYNNIYIYI